MRLALCRPDRVGDVILATACLEPIRQQFPGARLFFLAREAMRPLLEHHPLLDGFIALPGPGDSIQPLAHALREARPDALVHLHPDAVCQHAGQIAQVPRRLGYRHRWLTDRRTLTDRFPDHRREGTRHEAEYNFDLLAPLGIRPPATADELRPRVALAEEARGSLAATLSTLKLQSSDPYLVLNPTAYSPDLRWPAASFAELATELAHRRPELAIVLVAERVDDPSIVEIRQRLGSPPWLRDLAGRTNLGELGWLLRDARALVTRNTGTSHLAAAVGCPLVELFGRLEPRYGPSRWRALGDPGCTVVIAAHPTPRRWGENKRAWWRRAHAAIPTAEVLAAVLSLLAIPGRGRG